MKRIILLTLFLISSNHLWAQTTGYLDTTYNKAGTLKGQKLMSNLGGGARAIALDDKGRLVVAACSTNYAPFIYVYRLNSDGTLDATFGSASADTVKINVKPYGSNGGGATCLAIQNDGKILIGGTMDNGTSMLVIRLNTDGSRDNSFDGDGILTMDLLAGGTDQISNIAVQNNDKIILSGTSGGKLTILRLLSDGSKDTGFASFISTNIYSETVSGLEIINDTIFVGVSYVNSASTAVYNFCAVKLNPNGSLVFRKDVPYTTSSGSVGDLAVQPDGKIIIAGNDYNGFRAFRLNSNGQIDISFAGGNFLQSIGGFGVGLRSIVIEKNGKIDFIGTYNGSYAIMRVDSSGLLDNAFAATGKLLVGTGQYTSYAQGLLSSDQKLLISGDIYSSSAEVIKVEVKPVVHIIGNGYALPGTIEKYTVQVPPSWGGGVTYQWAYSGQYFNYVPSQTGYPLTLLFSDTATSGILSCTITSAAGVPLGSGEYNITINPEHSNASQLSKLDCKTNLTNCSLGYIDNFSMHNLQNSHSGCSDNGYSDFTRSNFTDTLDVGGVYSANLKIPNDGTFTSYVGIWIDYNNDGDFSNVFEFVGEGASSDSKVAVEIFLKNLEGFDGPKRLRVRSRPDVKITSNDACPSNGETGETEDYLILLDKQPSLEAPQIITPNEDGLNDYFVIHGVDPNKKNKLIIFDRIGAVKFSASNYENDWNGTAKDGTKLSPGTYYYVFTNDKNSVKGFLEIRY